MTDHDTPHRPRRAPYAALGALILLGASACTSSDEPSPDAPLPAFTSGAGGGVTATGGQGGADPIPAGGAGGAPTTSSATSTGATTSSSSSTATSSSSSTATSSSSSGGGCTPDCSTAECGLDPVCGTMDCGSCGVGDACQGGQCVCQPQCNGKSCGPDGCGGTCGTCSTGACDGNGQCVSECSSGQTSCNGNLEEQEVCVNGLWQTQSCPNYEVCVQGGCEAVCDGYLATQNNPSACIFPMDEGSHQGIFFYWNDPALAYGSGVIGTVGTSNTDAPIGPASGTAWPYKWYFAGNNGAFGLFKLAGFSPPVSEVWIHWRARRTGTLQNSWLTRWSITANNGSGVFASSTDTVSYSWTTHSEYVGGSLAQQFSPTAWNTMGVVPIGDGFGNPADLVELSWYMIEVVD